MVPTAEINRSKAARRRRSLKRGIGVWNLDRQLCRERVRRCALVTLTMTEAEPEAAIGRARDFWAKVRKRWLGTQYFCWLELQRRGSVHYHAIWLNPPFRRYTDLMAWVEREWPHGRTHVRHRNAQWVNQNSTDYVFGYAKKIGNKSYQQEYEGLPRELRTFMNQRLEIPPDKLKDHLEADVWEYVPPQLVSVKVQQGLLRGKELLELEPEKLRLVGHRQHVVELGARCSALDYRRPRLRSPSRVH